jgi:hypothetical protein
MCEITAEFDVDYEVTVASPSWEGYGLCAFARSGFALRQR